MRESYVENYLVERVKLNGGLVRKIQYIGRLGCPDRLVGFPNGRHALVELKAPKRGARPDQAREHTRLREVGFDVRVLNTTEAIDDFITEMTA